ncbi:YlxQ family RNA-binding protein [Salicibibacter kimchii]|uniref:YlxQ family RNA-binding protein n=1 Tax=Salicibibacter kimchii TaxID=2099786 RepID=A0A345BVW9_9BACI|nr:YlxQ family RNA-binding protein [Salicibibacter kimchii]AXF55100.1 YlxQ family RNA-binding protein [Salicibibacter kimchii]
MKQDFYRFLGLATRANRVVSGEETVINGIKKQRFHLVLISDDASTNTNKRLGDKCRHYHIPIRQAGTRQAMGEAIGKHERVVIGITDKGFSDKMIRMLDQ